jgi:hypothetical protein
LATTTTRTPQVRRRAARHVAYELGSLRETLHFVRGKSYVSRAMLESYLVHTRNLIEFFFDGATKGAMLPKDFGARSGRDGSMRALRQEISQLLSHLTWARVDIHELRPQDWSYSRLSKTFDAIRAKAVAFMAELPEEERVWFTCDAFPNEYRHWS